MSTLEQRLDAELGDRYAIERELARGGMAVVYLARDRKHGRRVALKLLDPAIGTAVGGERFHREIALLARLQHPHILPLYDSGGAAGSLYYVMPYVEGDSVRDRLDREGRLSVADALRIAIEVADALAYAHAHHVVHRDVKPENILLPGYPPHPGRTTGGWHAVVCDFGIARLTGRDSGTGLGGTGERHTAHGHAVGTPAYMSPEQASGERDVDGRADVYALGVVLYEMLAGAVPFSGETPREALAQRLSARPPRVSRLRRDVGRRVDDVLARAMEPDPARRFATAAELAEALQRCLAAAGARGAADARRTRWRWVAGGAVAVGAIAGAAVVAEVADLRPVERLLGRPALDAALVAVLPFAHGDAGPAARPVPLDGRWCGQLLLDAMARWRDVRLVDGMLVSDAMLRGGSAAPRTLADALATARRLGAGTLAWGDVRPWAGDTIVVRAALYDVASGRPGTSHTVRVAPDLGDAPRRFGELATALLLGRGARPPEAGGVGTDVLAASRAHDRGHRFLARWELDSAAAAFRDAVAADAGYAQAQLWLAQTLTWALDEASGSAVRDALRAAAAAAASGAARLAPQDATHAAALLALAEGRWADACARYRSAIRADSADFRAWYGLGECQARDGAVLRSPASPTGWAFRGSYEGAVRAYTRALRLVPSSHLAYRGAAFGRLERLLRTEGRDLRGGVGPGPDSARFAAYASLDGDTLAFVPGPIAEVFGGPPPATVGSAVARNRELLREVAEEWAASFPRSVHAHEALARAYELTGRIATAGGASAITALRAARAHATDPDQRLRLARMDVRLRVKAGDFAGARALADSLLRATPARSPARARELAGLAALTGSTTRLVALLRLAAVDHAFLGPHHEPLRVPTPVAEPALALKGFAALGAWPDSIVALARGADQAIADWVPRAERTAVRHAVLAIPLELAFPTIGLGPVAEADAGGSYLRALQRDLARRDLTAVRHGLARLAAARGAVRPGDVALDGTYQEAWILAAVGDTLAATRALDNTLRALAALDVALVDEVAQAAALGRAMSLRAELAARTGDRATAERWGAAVAALWRDADAPLRPLVARARALAGPRGAS